MSEQLALLPEYLTGHLQLTLVALLLGTAVSIPMGVLATRVRWLERGVLAVAGVIQTIPALALLAIMVPLLAALHLKGIGYLPAIIALTLYSVLPILRNTVTGISGVDAAYKEAARGVGMTPGQQLWRVELPLALPVIAAGVRISTVWVVGTATLSTPVGATSLGNYIFSGLQTRNFVAVLVGCVAAALLALLLDALIRMLESGLRARRRATVALSLSTLAALCLYTGASFAAEHWTAAPRAPVRIGAKTFTEQYILSQILAGQIGRRTGERTKVIASLGSTVAFDALRSGELDLYVDYSGTIWTTILKERGRGAGRQEVLRVVAASLRREYGIELVAALGFENAYALAMRGEQARRLGIKTIGELAAHSQGLSMGGDYEFFARPEWRSLQRSYGLAFRKRRSMDSSLMYQAVAHGSVDVISAFSTDGRIAALNLVVLEDGHGAIPPYDAIVLARGEFLSRRPAVARALGELAGTIGAARMRQMNRAVDEKGRRPEEVARAFLGGL